MSSLPLGWTRAPLSELVEILDSQRVPVNSDDRAARIAGKTTDELVPYYGATGQVGWIDKALFNEELVLLGEDGVAFHDLFKKKAYRISGKSWVNNHAHVLRAIAAKVDARYLERYLNRFDYVGSVTGTTRLKLTQAAMAQIPVVIAPIREQHRIADKLDSVLGRVDACRDRLTRVAPLLKRFRQSVLAAATNGDLTREWRKERGLDVEVQSFKLEGADAIRDFSFPASWSVRRLADIASITGGVTKDSKKQSQDFVELPYLRVANVQRGYLDLAEVKMIRVPPDRVSELLLRAGDILFNEGGDIDKLGRGWIWNDELPACVFQNHVFRARLVDSRFDPRFFSWYGNSRGHEYFLARGKQTTNLASINKSVLAALPVAVPPADEQREIVRRTSELLRFADRLERRCTNAAAKVVSLTPAVLAKAFRGELVAQDPNDEPASALLERLKSARTAAGAKLSRSTARKPAMMNNTDKDSMKAVILRLKSDRFSFEELRAQFSGDYESVKSALFELLEEPNPVVRQVFDQKVMAVQLVRVTS